MNSELRNRYVVLAWAAFLWAVGNSVYAYLVLGGERTFRVESAAFILVGVLLPLIFWRPSTVVEGEEALTQRDNRFLMVLALGLWLVTLVPFVTAPLLGDDYVFLASYRHLSDVLRLRDGQFFRPMFALVFFLLTRIAGGSTVPFHVVGLLIHATSAWFVYLLSRRLFQRADAATLCFALFLLNPLQLEAVLWVSGLQELLWTFFMLAGLVVYTSARVLSLWRLILTVVLTACALLAKETAVASALLLPAADWAFFRMQRGRWFPATYAGLAIIVATYLLVRARVTSIESGFFVTPGRYFTQKFVATPYRFFVQPWNLAAAHIPTIVPCCAAVLALAVLFWAVVRGTGPMALAGPAVILISTLPVYSFFFVRSDLLAARYVYFASIGWALFVAQLLTTVLIRRRALAAASATFIVVLFASLQVNVKPWRTAWQIVSEVAAALEEGDSPERSSDYWQAKYGAGLEVKDGIPTVCKGVNVFINGYPELRNMLSESRRR
jgi:hypothetical protein